MLKPIEKKSDKEKKEKRNRLLLAGFSVLIMSLSVIGFALNLGNRQSIQKRGGFWEFKVNIGGQEVMLQTIYLPNETKGTLFNHTPSINDFINKKYYYYSDASLKEKATRLLGYISYFSVLRGACVKGYKCYNKELPLKDCSSNLIIFEYNNKTSVDKRENCIILKGNSSNIDRVIDAFLYKIFRIEEIR